LSYAPSVGNEPEGQSRIIAFTYLHERRASTAALI